MSGRHHASGKVVETDFYAIQFERREGLGGRTYGETVIVSVEDDLTGERRQAIERPLPQPGSLAYAFRREGEELR